MGIVWLNLVSKLPKLLLMMSQAFSFATICAYRCKVFCMGMHRKHDFAIVFGFELLPPPPPPPFLSLFYAPFFFCSVWNFPGVILEQKVLGNFLGFVGLEGRKCRRVVEQDFHWNFWVQFLYFFHFSPVSLTELYLFWHIV